MVVAERPAWTWSATPSWDMLRHQPGGLDRFAGLITDGEPTLVEGCIGLAKYENFR